jgi:hypothetical protein
MYRITVTMDIDSELDEQARTVARKVHQAIQTGVKPGPCHVKWEVKLQKRSTSRIIQPATSVQVP